MTNRKQRKALARWEDQTRGWAHRAARELVLALVSGQPRATTPYAIGVVLDPGERVWSECPVRFLQEYLPAGGLTTPPVRTWLVTSDRIVGRLGDDSLYGWRWDQMRGCRIELAASSELVELDTASGNRLDWAGPGVAPLAVAAAYRLHGHQALLEHPGLAPIRLGDVPISEDRSTAIALPSWRQETRWWLPQEG